MEHESWGIYTMTSFLIRRWGVLRQILTVLSVIGALVTALMVAGIFRYDKYHSRESAHIASILKDRLAKIGASDQADIDSSRNIVDVAVKYDFEGFKSKVDVLLAEINAISRLPVILYVCDPLNPLQDSSNLDHIMIVVAPKKELLLHAESRAVSPKNTN